MQTGRQKWLISRARSRARCWRRLWKDTNEDVRYIVLVFLPLLNALDGQTSWSASASESHSFTPALVLTWPTPNTHPLEYIQLHYIVTGESGSSDLCPKGKNAPVKMLGERDSPVCPLDLNLRLCYQRQMVFPYQVWRRRCQETSSQLPGTSTLTCPSPQSPHAMTLLPVISRQ